MSEAEDAWVDSVEVMTEYERGRQDGINQSIRLAYLVLKEAVANELEIEALKARVEAEKAKQTVSLLEIMKRQEAWSLATFGPIDHTHGLLDHIRRECVEVEKNPSDVMEWIDIAQLALDGAWRHSSAERAAAAYVEKLGINEARSWPDWRTIDPTKAVEHVREEAKP